MQLVREQEAWMARCGGTLLGYVAKYGSIHDQKHYGDGGEAIYAADFNALQDLKREAGLPYKHL
jgi:hypothetical protein